MVQCAWRHYISIQHAELFYKQIFQLTLLQMLFEIKN